jgi:hypothetical protein
MPRRYDQPNTAVDLIPANCHWRREFRKKDDRFPDTGTWWYHGSDVVFFGLQQSQDKSSEHPLFKTDTQFDCDRYCFRASPLAFKRRRHLTTVCFVPVLRRSNGFISSFCFGLGLPMTSYAEWALDPGATGWLPVHYGKLIERWTKPQNPFPPSSLPDDGRRPGSSINFSSDIS